MQVADKFSRIIERLVPEGSLDLKMKTTLANEVRRRLAEFEAVDRRFRQKYAMTLEEFERRGVVKDRGSVVSQRLGLDYL
jgi:hypothetical protein